MDLPAAAAWRRDGFVVMPGYLAGPDLAVFGVAASMIGHTLPYAGNVRIFRAPEEGYPARGGRAAVMGHPGRRTR
jgi:hypothetical protein